MVPTYSGRGGAVRSRAATGCIDQPFRDYEATPKPARWMALVMAAQVGAFRQTHLAALEVDRERRGAGAGGGTGDGLHAAVAIHAGDLEDEFLSHVI